MLVLNTVVTFILCEEITPLIVMCLSVLMSLDVFVVSLASVKEQPGLLP